MRSACVSKPRIGFEECAACCYDKHCCISISLCLELSLDVPENSSPSVYNVFDVFLCAPVVAQRRSSHV